MTVPAPRLFIHHTDTDPSSSSSRAEHQRYIQDLHMDGRGWDDLAYSFIVYPDGAVLEGRGWGIKGCRLGAISYDHEKLRGHRDVKNTECPGEALYQEMPHLLFV